MFSVFKRCFFVATRKRKAFLLFSNFEKHSDDVSKCIGITHNARFKHTFKPIGLREGPQPSRYHPGSRIEATEEHIKSTLSNKSSMNEDDWKDFKLDLMTDFQVVTDENFDSIVMNCLLSSNKLDFAHSLLKYLDNNNIKPNFLTYLKYIALCSKNRDQVTQELILSTFDKVRYLIDKNPVLDMTSVECTVHGLTATDKWRESFDYLKKLTTPPSLEIRNSLACAAIRNGDEALAWNILTTWIKDGESPGYRVMEEFLLVALDMQKKHQLASDIFIKKVFKYMETKAIIVNLDVAKLIERYFICHQTKWKILHAKVKRNGHCEKCDYNLQALDLNSVEYNLLKQSFLERVVKKSDVFINTTTKEFDRFINFIENNKPFHIVMDGLNAAYSCPLPRTKPNLASQLLKITKLMSRKTVKILILGKHHMLRWPSHTMHKIAQRARVFYTDDISQDDPFTIYAALASGPHTQFVSDDLMRDHMSRLDDPKCIQLFKKWQLSHQIYVQTDKENNIKFIEPVRHCICVQGSMKNGWHIPFDDKIALDPYEELNNWLCINRE